MLPITVFDLRHIRHNFDSGQKFVRQFLACSVRWLSTPTTLVLLLRESLAGHLTGVRLFFASWVSRNVAAYVDLGKSSQIQAFMSGF